MFKKTTLLFLLLFFVISSHAQKLNLTGNYEEYFKNTREIPYLHLNKTSFLKGEEIWFQSYVIEQNSKKLHPTTSNLYVAIFDKNGNLKEQKLIHIKEGIGAGSFLINSSYTSEKYYLKASTNWMKNFKEDHSFVQEIKIVNNFKKSDFESLDEKDFFDFQVFPEGGYLLANVNNSVGILIKDKNGNGVKTDKILLKNSYNEVVKTVSTNNFGLGKVRFNQIPGQYYYLEAFLENGSVISKELPFAEDTGVTMRVENSSDQFLAINLITNLITLSELIDKKYKILIHNTNFYYKRDITFVPNNNIYSLLINKDKLAKGTNIITVFDDKGNPILERVFFNYHKSLFADANIEAKKVSYDSLRASFNNPSKEKVFLSASFLPIDTKAENPTNNIYTSIFLKPFIKGEVENPDYYFTNITRKKLIQLDLLLITQGWSRYKWNNIFKGTQNLNFKFENGISLTGRLNKALTHNEKIVLVSNENDIVRDIEVKEQKFELTNEFIKKSSELNFALSRNNNLYKIKPILQFSKTIIDNELNKKFLKEEKNRELLISNFQQLGTDRELLSEIKLKSKLKEAIEDKPYGSDVMLNGANLKNESWGVNQRIPDWLRYKRVRFRAIADAIDGRNTTLDAGNGPSGFGAGSSNAGPAVIGGTRVFLDNNDVTMSLWQLSNIYLNDVKEIFFGRNNKAWADDVIYIYLKDQVNIARRENSFDKVIVNFGFNKERDYYQPKYPSYTNETYKNYGAVFWKPKIVLNSESNTNIKITMNLQDKLLVRIEGITENGKLLSKKIILNK